MENEYIELILSPKVTYKFNSNNPDIDGLIKKIIELQKEIIPENIKIRECSNSNFDCKGFVHVIKSTVKDFLDNIKLNNDLYDDCIKKIQYPDINNDMDN